MVLADFVWRVSTTDVVDVRFEVGISELVRVANGVARATVEGLVQLIWLVGDSEGEWPSERELPF